MEQNDLLPDLTIDPSSAYHLRSIASWAKFLSIVGFVFCGLVALVAIFAGSVIATSMSSYERYSNYGSGVGVAITISYLIGVGIFFIPNLFLFQSAEKLKTALDTTDQDRLTEGFAKLRSYFKFWGIMTIIIISIYALMFLFGILTVLTSR